MNLYMCVGGVMGFISLCCVLYDTGSVSGCPKTYYVTQASLKLPAILPALASPHTDATTVGYREQSRACWESAHDVKERGSWVSHPREATSHAESVRTSNSPRPASSFLISVSISTTAHVSLLRVLAQRGTQPKSASGCPLDYDPCLKQ